MRLAEKGLAVDECRQEQQQQQGDTRKVDSFGCQMEDDYYRSNINSYDAARRLDNFDLPRDDVAFVNSCTPLGVGPAAEGGAGVQMHLICRWFRERGHCIKGDACPDLHVYTGEGFSDGALPVHINSVAQNELPIPGVG